MLSAYEKNNLELENNIYTEMLHIYDSRKVKRITKQVKFFVKGDSRPQYRVIVKNEA